MRQGTRLWCNRICKSDADGKRGANEAEQPIVRSMQSMDFGREFVSKPSSKELNGRPGCRVGAARTGRTFVLRVTGAVALSFVVALGMGMCSSVAMAQNSTPSSRMASTAEAHGASQGAAAVVLVNTKRMGAYIPKGFVGFSNEVSTAGQGLGTPMAKASGTIVRPAGVPADAKLVYVLGQPGAPNTDFFNFMRNLGPGILRLGGHSEDTTCWDPKHAPHPSWCNGPITRGQIKLYSTAIKAAGWKLVLGLNLKQNSPRWALSEVTDGVDREIPADKVIGFQLGNGPANYAKTVTRPKDYSPQDYVHDVLGYAHAFHANPVARKYKFVAPATCCGWNNPHDLGIILKGIGRYLAVVTIQHYPDSVGGHRIVTVADLISAEKMKSFNEFSRKMIAVAHKYHLPMGLLETNSVADGGMAGVSNAFASAVWGLDYMFNVKRDGYTHIDFHFSYRRGGSAYNPVRVFGWKVGHTEHYRNVAEPLYYAMYMFAKNATGEHLLPASIQTNSHITSFATTACSRCAIHVFVINEDETASGPVDMRLSSKAGKASLLMLQAPRLNSLAADVRYGGRQFNTDGDIGTPQTTRVKPGSHGVYRFMLPNASIALLTIAR